MAKYLYKYHEERGEFNAYVEDKDGKTIWEVRYPDFYEDELSGELVEGSTIFEDGYMKDASDIEGLEKYLKEMQLLQSGDELVDEEEDLHEVEESLAEDFIEDVKEMHNAIAEIVLTDGTRIKGKDLMMEQGGSVEEGNNRMLMSNVKEIKHHAEELGNIVKPNSRVDAWVVAKAERSASDLSDITHYMDSNEESFAKGGMIRLKGFGNKMSFKSVVKGINYKYDSNVYDKFSDKQLSVAWYEYYSVVMSNVHFSTLEMARTINEKFVENNLPKVELLDVSELVRTFRDGFSDLHKLFIKKGALKKFEDGGIMAKGGLTPESMYQKLIDMIPIAQVVDGRNIHDITTTKEIASMLGVSTSVAYRNMIKLEEEGKVAKYGYKTRDGWEDAQHSNLKSNSIGWQIDSIPESMAKGGMTMGLSKEETKRIAQKFADALSIRDKVDVSVNKYLEEDNFDLDYNGIEYGGGSYTILANGDVRNDALSNMPIYGNAKDSIETIIKKIDHADSGYMAKGGNVTSIEKKVAEVNELIREGNEKGIEVVDTSITWQSPMKYKPFKYSNGVLYEEYEELDLYSNNRGEGIKWNTKKYKFTKNSSFGIDDQKGVLNQVARWYRKAIKHYNTYGYADGGMMARGGKTKAINKRWKVVTKSHGRDVSGIITLGIDSKISDVKRRMREMGYNSKSIVSIESEYANGGVVYVDLFEDYENMPKKVSKILDRYYDRYGEDMDYKDTQNMLEEVEKVGYTFDYYLDNNPYGLRPIGVELNQLRGYEDMD